MSAYLKFYQLEHAPFEAGERSHVVLGTPALRDAFDQIESGLDDGAPRICVNGRAGLGKTSLARALPKMLAGKARVVVLLKPASAWTKLRASIVRQLDLLGGVLSRKSLLARREDGQRLVVVIDAAEQIDRESLEHLDILLAYRTDDDRQLVHCVLLANLENARQQDECPLLWWLDSLNTLQLEFTPIPVSGVRSYIVKHLKRAGWTGGELFSAEAARAIHRLTGGVPRSVSALCEQVLETAGERGLDAIDVALVEEVAGEETTGGAADAMLDAPLRPANTGADPTPSTASGPASTATEVSSPPQADARGLDTFFTPGRKAATAAPPNGSTSEPDIDHGLGVPDGPSAPASAPAGFAELDPEASGAALRWIAAAVFLIGAVGSGLFYAGLIPSMGEDVAEAPTVAVEQAAATGKSAQERLSALARSASAPRPADGQQAATGSSGEAGAAERPEPIAGAGVAPPAPGVAQPGLADGTISVGRADTPIQDVATAETPGEAAAPAAAAPIDPMDRDDGRHF